jgi:hypothetical protein
MGLLDDAIREHLELKRRRGADPGEVERQEHEVLGDTPRAEFVDPSGEEAGPATAEARPATAEEPAPEPEVPEDAGAEPFDVDAQEPEPEASAAPPPATDPWLDEDDRDEVPADESLARRPGEDPPAEGGEEDVLQDTPEFLQETPEHDRLWFEQRPPRDFDWDK